VERREAVRYTSPHPDAQSRQRSLRGGARATPTAISPRRGTPAASAPRAELPAMHGARRNQIVLEPEHLASLTQEQRADLRLWHGRVNLLDRVKTLRGYTWATLGAIGLGIAGLIVGANEAPPLVLSPIVPIYMTVKMWRRGKSLRESGLRLRRVLLMPRARWVIPAPAPEPMEQELEKLASREILDSPQGPPIRRAVSERAAIREIVAGLSKAERVLLPKVEPAVDALVAHVAHLARMLHRLEQSIDPRLIDELDVRIADAERESDTPDGARRLALYRRQRETVAELVERRAALQRQLDSAGLALGNIRLDLVKFRASGLPSALSDVTTATQEARVLSEEIGALLEVADGV
jgi:serine/threonine-protein kinase